jgi:hypothetical protein
MAAFDGGVRVYRDAMAAFEVIYIAATLGTAAGVGFEGTVPGGVGLDIAYHIICLVVPSKTVPAILFTKRLEKEGLRAKRDSVIFVANEN